MAHSYHCPEPWMGRSPDIPAGQPIAAEGSNA